MAESPDTSARAEDANPGLEERVRIAILVRWVLISTAMLSAATSVAGHTLMESPIRLASPVLPLTGLAAWVGLNAFFQLFYKRLFRYKSFLYGQILVDLLVPIPFLYLSGGIFSYGWLEYPLITLEAALILPRRSDPWLVAVVS